MEITDKSMSMREVLLWLLMPFGVYEQKVPEPIERKSARWEQTISKTDRKYGK